MLAKGPTTMADIVNLRQARKAKAKRDKETQAEANRIQFGRAKAEKKLTEARNSLAQSKLDAHKTPETPDES
jgi:hypothetical protein